jgi:glycosyltransferase involved in cell wall biosynthesis
MPLVSVIIPTLDRPEFLRAALRSVLGQLVEDLEVLVIDDGSATSVLPLLDALNDSRIRYFRHESNRGEAAARNTGILNAQGAYVAFLDDDDEWLPEKLRLQLELFGQGSGSDKVGCVYGGYVSIRARDGQVLSRHVPTRRGDLSRVLWRRNVLGTPSTVMIRRECLERVGLFDENIAFGVDYDLWIRVAQEYRFDFVPDIVARYKIHEGQMTNDAVVRVKGHADFLRKYGSRLRPDRERASRIYFNLGRQMCLRGHSVEGRRAFLKALRINPVNIRAYVYLALSLCGPMSVSTFRTLVSKFKGINPVNK